MTVYTSGQCPKCGLDLEFDIEGGSEVCQGVDLGICDRCGHPHIADDECTICGATIVL